MSTTLYLIPNFLHDETSQAASLNYLSGIVDKIRCFMVENEKSARRLLKKVNPQFPVQECTFFELSEHTSLKEAKKFFEAQLAKK